MKLWITVALIALLTVSTYPLVAKAGDILKDCDACPPRQRDVAHAAATVA